MKKYVLAGAIILAFLSAGHCVEGPKKAVAREAQQQPAQQSSAQPRFNYAKADQEERLEYLKNWQPKTDIEKLQRDAMIARESDDYRTLIDICNKILAQKDAGGVAVPVSHFYLQFAYERLEDTESEMKELKWITDNVILETGEYSFATRLITSDMLYKIEERKRAIREQMQLEAEVKKTVSAGERKVEKAGAISIDKKAQAQKEASVPLYEKLRAAEVDTGTATIPVSGKETAGAPAFESIKIDESRGSLSEKAAKLIEGDSGSVDNAKAAQEKGKTKK